MSRLLRLACALAFPASVGWPSDLGAQQPVDPLRWKVNAGSPVASIEVADGIVYVDNDLALDADSGRKLS